MQKGVVIWLTGLSGAGKTTIANSVYAELAREGLKIERLDGDKLREHITKDLGFSREDRLENLRRAAFVAGMLAKHGVVVLASFITPYESIREEIREKLEIVAPFFEVYVNASVEECKRRDVKGLYAKAERGEIENFTGISDPFENPEKAALVLDTENNDLSECKRRLIDFLYSKGILQREIEVKTE